MFKSIRKKNNYKFHLEKSRFQAVVNFAFKLPLNGNL